MIAEREGEKHREKGSWNEREREGERERESEEGGAAEAKAAFPMMIFPHYPPHTHTSQLYSS